MSAFTAYRCPKAPELWDALVKGFGAKDVPIGSPLEGVPLINGLQFGALEFLQDVVRQRVDYLFLDGAYFLGWPPPRKWYRAVPNAYQKNWVDDVKPDRWETIGLKMKPWRKGSYVLITPPSEYVGNLFGFSVPLWLQKTVTVLKEHTDRPLMVREKYSKGTIQEDLKDAHCLVTWTSNTSVDALLEGVPVFVPSVSQAAPVGCTDITKVETPVYPDREPWAWSLAYGQFTLKEIASGLAKEVVCSRFT